MIPSIKNTAWIISLGVLFSLLSSCNGNKAATSENNDNGNGNDTIAGQVSKVYMTSSITHESLLAVYQGRRSTPEIHWQAIREHGFLDIAPVDLMDEEGEMQLPVRDSTHIKYNIVGAHLANYDFLINLAHFKGHAMAGYGGVLKNQSIGIATPEGKSYIHSAGRTQDVSQMWVQISQTSVALDQACLDLVYSVTPVEGNDNRPLIERIESRNGIHTVEYAWKIGLGNRKYEIIHID